MKKAHGVNSLKAFEIQVQSLLGQVSDKIKNLSKKEAIKLLEYSLKHPYEHEEVAGKLTTPAQKELMLFIDSINVAKQNMVLTFINEYGQELNAEQLRLLDEEAAKKNFQEEVKAFEEEIEATPIEEEVKKCSGDCNSCKCKGE